MSDPVHARFMAYSGFGDKTQAGQMDGKLFAKLCKETGIIDKKCTATDVDLIFARAKPKGGRKLDFGAFTDACVMLAEKRFAKTLKDEGKEAAVRKLYELIAGSAGPQANAVSAHKQHIRRRKSEPACNNNKVQELTSANASVARLRVVCSTDQGRRCPLPRRQKHIHRRAREGRPLHRGQSAQPHTQSTRAIVELACASIVFELTHCAVPLHSLFPPHRPNHAQQPARPFGG